MIKDDRVNTWLEAMDLRIRDVGADRIFAFLAGPDMSLTLDELCSGMSRLRGAAQGLDVVTLLEIAAPELKMPLSRDLLLHNVPIKDVAPQKTEGTLAPGASEMKWAAAELLSVMSDLRKFLASHRAVGPSDVELACHVRLAEMSLPLSPTVRRL